MERRVVTRYRHYTSVNHPVKLPALRNRRKPYRLENSVCPANRPMSGILVGKCPGAIRRFLLIFHPIAPLARLRERGRG